MGVIDEIYNLRRVIVYLLNLKWREYQKSKNGESRMQA
jgi:hypothetical protein